MKISRENNLSADVYNLYPIGICRLEYFLSFKANQLPQRHIYPNVSYHPISLQQMQTWDSYHVWPHSHWYSLSEHITIHHIHRPESLKASLISYPMIHTNPWFSPWNHFPSSVHFISVQNSIKFFHVFCLPSYLLDSCNNIFTTFPECAFQLLQNFLHTAATVIFRKLKTLFKIYRWLPLF